MTSISDKIPMAQFLIITRLIFLISRKGSLRVSISIMRRVINSTALQLYYTAGITTGPLALFIFFFDLETLYSVIDEYYNLQTSTGYEPSARNLTVKFDDTLKTRVHIIFSSTLLSRIQRAHSPYHCRTLTSRLKLCTSPFSHSNLQSEICTRPQFSRTIPSRLKMAFFPFNFTVQNPHQAFLLSTVPL